MEIETYDAEIRRFVPGYEDMIEAAMNALAVHLTEAPHILDLGAGTGALSAAALKRFPNVRITLIDVDKSMLEQAKKRLRNDQGRVELKAQSFNDALPKCDGAMASLSLHHVHDPKAKRSLYENIKSSLKPGAPLVTADAMVPPDGKLKDHVMKQWAAHLISQGDTELQAIARFQTWAEEDHYFSIEEELTLLQKAGFQTRELTWRQGPLAVLVALP